LGDFSVETFMWGCGTIPCFSLVENLEKPTPGVSRLGPMGFGMWG